jgi:hypothetical protein
VRCIVKSTELDKALTSLRDAGFIAKVSDIVCVRIPNRPLGLARVLQILDENGISVEYSYSFCRSTLDDAVIILRSSDKENCVKSLTEGGVKLISQSEVDGF